MILCWAAFIAILGCMQPVERGLYIPIYEQLQTYFCPILYIIYKSSANVI